MNQVEFVVFVWTCTHHLSALILNITALVALIMHWQKLKSSNQEALIQTPITLGFNLILLVVVECPTLFWWVSRQNYLFGVRLCHYVWITKILPEAISIQGTATLVMGIWTRKNDAKRVSCRSVGLTLLCSVFYAAILSLSRIYQPRVGLSAALAFKQEWNLFETRICPHWEQHLTWYTLVFRWIIGFFLPWTFSLVLLIDVSIRPRGKSQQFKVYKHLSTSLLICHLITQTPLMLLDFFYFAHGYANNSAMNTVATILTKLHFSFFPLALIFFLPWRNSVHENQLQLRYLYRQKRHPEPEIVELLE